MRRNPQVSIVRVRDDVANPSRDLLFARADAEVLVRNRSRAEAWKTETRAREKCLEESTKRVPFRTCSERSDTDATTSLSERLERSDGATAFAARVPASRSLPVAHSSTRVLWACGYGHPQQRRRLRRSRSDRIGTERSQQQHVSGARALGTTLLGGVHRIDASSFSSSCSCSSSSPRSCRCLEQRFVPRREGPEASA